MLACVVNVSEGRRAGVLAALAAAAGADLLDQHADPHHNRTVLTLLGEDAPRRVAAAAVEAIDLRAHEGAHPRIGAVDVVPFVPLEGSGLERALDARDRFAQWAAATLGVPCFLYGPERTLPDVRRRAAAGAEPDVGADRRHPTAGACAVGARPVLVAYNLWLAEPDLGLARDIARRLRGPAVRALGLAVGSAVQVSCNLVEPFTVGPGAVFDAVEEVATVARAELVGLVPAAVLAHEARPRWARLDLAEDRTIEARLAARGIS